MTTLGNSPQEVYERGYCARGEMENRIKEYQLRFFADRTSCPLRWPNQFRLLLASLAYVLMERLRAIGLVGTELARAQVGTVHTRLLKIGAVIVRNTRRVRFFLSSAFPHQAIFRFVAERFASGSPISSAPRHDHYGGWGKSVLNLQNRSKIEQKKLFDCACL